VTAYRLTRRGRLVLQTLPLFVVTAVAITALGDRVGGADASPGAASSAAPPTTAAPAPTTPAATPSRSATPSATPSRSATPKPTPKATPTQRSYAGSGALAVVPGSSAVHGSGPLRRFTVEVEKGLPGAPADFAKAVEDVLFDERSWGGGGRLSFQRVSSGPVAFRVVLASPGTTDRLCRPLDTGGIFSCYMNGRAVLNAWRWYEGATAYAGDLASYRIYMVNHEVGHALGHGHRYVCGARGLAPVMIQQTKGLRGCGRNPWPLADER
jgi:hypothetical protein